MPITTDSYALRHLMRCTTTSNFAILARIAGLDRDRDGRVSMADVDLTRMVGYRCSLQTVRRNLRTLLDDGRALRRDGDDYVIVGAAEHDCLTCDNRHCVREVEVARRRDEWYRVANRRRR